MLIACPIKLIGSLTRRLFVKGHQITEYYLIKTAIQLVTKQRIMFVCKITVCMNDPLGTEWSHNPVLVRGEEHLGGVLDWLPTVHLFHSSNLEVGGKERRRGKEREGRREEGGELRKWRTGTQAAGPQSVLKAYPCCFKFQSNNITNHSRTVRALNHRHRNASYSQCDCGRHVHPLAHSHTQSATDPLQTAQMVVKGLKLYTQHYFSCHWQV